jgi:hypothetical protein
MPPSVSSLIEHAQKIARGARPKYRMHNCSQDPTEPPMHWRTEQRPFSVDPGRSVEVGDIYGVPPAKAYDWVRKGIKPEADQLYATAEEVIRLALLAHGEHGLVMLSPEQDAQLDERIIAEGVKTWAVSKDKKTKDIISIYERRRSAASRNGQSAPSMTDEERSAMLWQDAKRSEALRGSGKIRKPCAHRCGFEALTADEMEIHLLGSHPHDPIPGTTEKPVDKLETPAQASPLSRRGRRPGTRNDVMPEGFEPKIAHDPDAEEQPEREPSPEANS